MCGGKNFEKLDSYDCRSHALWREGLPFVISWSQCPTCKHVFTNGYFSDEALAFMMETTQEGQKVAVSEVERIVMSEIVDRIAPESQYFKLPVGRWLDVGFGSGALMMTAREYGYDVAGLDLRQKTVDDMKSRWYNAHRMTIEQYADVCNRQFDVISMLDVLEHMPFPHKALEAANFLLNPGGKLIVSCPNTDTDVWIDLTNRMMNPYWIEIEHYHNFSRTSLASALIEHKFDPVKYNISKRYRSCMEIISVKTGEDHSEGECSLE